RVEVVQLRLELLRLVDLPFDDDAAADDNGDDQEARAHRDVGEALLVLVLRHGVELFFVRLLAVHGLHAGLILRFEARLLHFGVPDRFEPRRFFTRACFFTALALVLGAKATFFFFALAAFGLHPRLRLDLFAPATVVVLFLDPILLEVHQLLEREKDRALLL